jgi:ubiquinone/menaquinone biosynthesis C-methylase UbiE
MVDTIIDNNSYEAQFEQSQRLVNAFFGNRPRYWRDVYRGDTLDALIYRERQASVLAMVDKLGLPEGSRVLEVGCGAGLTTVALAQRRFTVDAIDTVEAMLSLTRQAAFKGGVNSLVRTTLNSVLDMAFPEQHFELLVAMGVLPWLKCVERALLEMTRVVKHGGYMILTVDNHWCLNQVFDPLCFPGLRTVRWKIGDVLEALHFRTSSRPRLYRHSIKRIDQLLYQSGFQKIQGATLGFGPFTFLKRKLLPEYVGIALHRRLQTLADRRWLGIRSLGTEYVVMARKSQVTYKVFTSEDQVNAKNRNCCSQR